MNEEQRDLIVDLGVNEEAKSNLKDVALWARINAITSFITLAVGLVSLIIGLSKLNSGAATGSGLFGFLITASISLLLNITLYTASDAIRKAVETTDQSYFDLGVTKLATYFKILGIIIIVALSIVVLVFLFLMVVGVGRLV